MQVVEKPKIINALYFDGTWENGIEIVKTLKEYGDYAVLNFGGEDNYIQGGHGVSGRNEWFVYPVYTTANNTMVMIMTDCQFRKKYIQVQ